MRRTDLQRLLAGGLVLFMLPNAGCKKQAPSDGDGGMPALASDDIAAAVNMYVNAAAGNDGEYFVVFDENKHKEVRLKPGTGDCKMVGKVADNMYFACAEFLSADGDTYDLDIFVTGKNKNDLMFAELMIHSVNGRKRFEWYTDDGLWKRKPVTGQTGSAPDTERGTE